MQKHHIVPRLLLPFIAMLIPSVVIAQQRNPDDRHWDDRFGPSGISGTVAAIVVRGDDVYAAGQFNLAGGVAVRNIARWDGTRWWPVGDGIPYPATAMEIAPNGDIYVATDWVVTATGDTAFGIARWDGLRWWPLGKGLRSKQTGHDARVRSIVIDGSNIYVAGEFTNAGEVAALGVARWNGTTWSAIGNGFQYGATAIAAKNGKIYATYGNVFEWTGSLWKSIGTPSYEPFGDNGARAAKLAIVGGDLYVSGSFIKMSGVAADHIARWDGASWHPLGKGISWGGISSDPVFTLVADGRDLYVGGSFLTIDDGIEVNNMARWNGRDWQPVGGGVHSSSLIGVTGSVSAITVAHGKIYVGGSFEKAGTNGVRNIAAWSPDNGWSAMYGGASGELRALAVTGDSVWVGGLMSSGFGGVLSASVSYWHDTDTPYMLQYANLYGPSINALAASNGYVFAGGDDAWKRDVISWSLLDDRGSHGMNGTIHALAAVGNDIYAGGSFDTIAGKRLSNIARWNSNGWHRLGAGVNGTVHAIAVDENYVYVGGEFTKAGDIEARNIAVWDGSTWSALDDGADAVVYAIVVQEDGLYAGGKFSNAGGVTATGIAHWDGESWSPVGGGVSGEVNALVVYGGNLYAGGRFASAGDGAASNIARWSGTKWHPLGSGTNGPVKALAVGSDGLYVAGSFDKAGGKYAYNFTRWNHSVTSAPPKSLEPNLAIAGSPNPFSGSTSIRIDIPRAAHVGLEIYNASGEKITTLLDGRVDAGPHELRWDAGELPEGVFFCRLRYEGAMRTLPIIKR